MSNKTMNQTLIIQKKTQKLPYNSPTLKVFGRVHALTQGVGSMNGDAGQTMMIPSDRSIKENIVQVGTHPLGLNLYIFDYKPAFCAFTGNSRQFGVMADEVEAVMPEAVLMHPDGYKQVNYAMLGINPSLRCVH